MESSKPNKKNRSRDYYRYNRKKAINRKYNIRKNLWGTQQTEEYYNCVAKGSLSKGKIHCSCPMCRTKSHDELDNCDKKKIDSMNDKLNEYLKK